MATANRQKFKGQRHVVMNKVKVARCWWITVVCCAAGHRRASDCMLVVDRTVGLHVSSFVYCYSFLFILTKRVFHSRVGYMHLPYLGLLFTCDILLLCYCQIYVKETTTSTSLYKVGLYIEPGCISLPSLNYNVNWLYCLLVLNPVIILLVQHRMSTLFLKCVT